MNVLTTKLTYEIRNPHQKMGVTTSYTKINKTLKFFQLKKNNFHNCVFQNIG